MSLSKQWEKTSPEQRREAAGYVAAMVSELRQLARRNDLPTLAYLLDMARLEAEADSREEDVSDDEASAPFLERP